MKKTQHTAGFTLIEIIITIGIIAILIGILLPVISMARRRAGTVTCANNLRQLYGAFALYAEDNDGLLPPYQNQLHRGIGVEGKGVSYFSNQIELLQSALTPYGVTSSANLWFCPADPYARTVSEEGRFRHTRTSYRVNALLGLPEVAWVEGEHIALDGFYLPWISNQAPPAGEPLLTDCPIHYAGPETWAPSYAHPGRTFNTLYLDGHITASRWEAAPSL